MTGTGQEEQAPRVRPDLETTRLAGWTFVFDRGPRRLHRLNPTAATVLEGLDGRQAPAALAARLADEYGADPSVVLADVLAILDEFAGEGLLEGSPPAPRGDDPVVAGLDPRPSGVAGAMAARLARRPGAVELGPYAALGARFSVTIDDAAAAGPLAEVLGSLGDAPGPAPVAGRADPCPPGPLRRYHLRRPRRPTDTWRLHLDATRIHRAHSVGGAVDHLLWHVNRVAVTSCADHTVLHAAGATRGGRAVLLPGESNAGKSTLVTGLVRAGWGYLSDEALVLDGDAVLWPFPKAIDLDRGSWPVFEDLAPPPEAAALHQTRWHVSPDRLRPAAPATATPLGAVVSPRYEQGVATRLEPLGADEAFSILLEQAFHLGARPGALEQVARLVEAVPCHRLVSGDLDAAVAAVDEVAAGWAAEADR